MLIEHSELLAVFSLLIQFRLPADGQRRVEGGQILMNMEETFFVADLAMLHDRCGTSWMLGMALEAGRRLHSRVAGRDLRSGRHGALAASVPLMQFRTG